MRKPKGLEALEAAENPPSPITIPPGAQITAKFEAPVDTDRLTDYPDELRELATKYGDNEPEPLDDPISEFCDTWRDYIGYPLRIIRLPDPPQRRLPGSTYNRPCFGEIEQLGETQFDPTNLIALLQVINGNSGGVFRLWLTDHSGTPLSDARLSRVVVADPPKIGNQPVIPTLTPPPPPKELTDLEKQLQELQRRVWQKTLDRILEPPPEIVNPAQNTTGLSDEDRLTLLLVKEGGLLPTVVQKLATLAGAPETATVKETWQERLINAGVSLAEKNPAIVERVSNTLERIVARVLPGSTSSATEPPPPAPRYQIAQPQAIPSHPSQQAHGPQSEDNDEEDLMNITEELFTLLTSNDDLTASHPVFLQLKQEYPLRFPFYVKVIASQSLDDLIAWISDQSPLYEALLTNDTTGPRYRERLAALQKLCQQ